jgi:hypothetical protein
MTTMTRVVLPALVSLLLGAACTRLPEGFDALPPARKVETYVAYLDQGGRPDSSARDSIVKDGMRAADAIATLLGQPIGDFEKQELVSILSAIEFGGTDLKSSRAASALQELARKPTSGRVLKKMAEDTLRRINGDPEN